MNVGAVIQLAICAVHESLPGTFEACQPAGGMSGYRGGAEVVGT